MNVCSGGYRFADDVDEVVMIWWQSISEDCPISVITKIVVLDIGLINRDTFIITAPSRDRATMGFPYAPNPLVMSELITATFCGKPSAPLVVRFDSGYTGIPGNGFKTTFCRFTL
jgi:hypothetical protein